MISCEKDHGTQRSEHAAAEPFHGSDADRPRLAELLEKAGDGLRDLRRRSREAEAAVGRLLARAAGGAGAGG